MNTVNFVCTSLLVVLFAIIIYIVIEECLPSWKKWFKKIFPKKSKKNG